MKTLKFPKTMFWNIKHKQGLQKNWDAGSHIVLCRQAIKCLALT